MINFRLAEEQDTRQLAEMRWDFRLEENAGVALTEKALFLTACADFLQHGLENRTWAYWIALDARLIVSHIFVQRIAKVPKPNRLHDEFGYVTNVYTRPVYRNHGIGTQLMQHVLTWAHEQDFENLLVWPSERSVPFYQRAGFQQDGEALAYSVRPYVQ